MGFGIRAMLIATPHMVPVLQLVSPEVYTTNHESVSDTSKPRSNNNSMRSSKFLSHTKVTAKEKFHKYTANIFGRNEANVVTTNKSYPCTSTTLPSCHSLATTAPFEQSQPNLGLPISLIEELVNPTSSHSSSVSMVDSISYAQRDTPTPPSSAASSAHSSQEDYDARDEQLLSVQTNHQTNFSGIVPKLRNVVEAEDYDTDPLKDTFVSPEATNLSDNMASPLGLRDRLKVKLKRLWKPSVKGGLRRANAGGNAQATGVDSVQHLEGDRKPEEENSEWRHVRAIPDEKILELVRRVCDPLRELNPRHIAVTGHREGAFHRVTLVILVRNRKAENYVVRVPAHGTAALWTEQDKYMMQREVDMMQYIRLHTKAPISEIFDYDTGLNNSLGMPYILESRLDGAPAYDIWFDENESYHPRTAFPNADCPSEQTQKKRVNFLRSLARAMGELGTLRFNQFGSLIVNSKPCTIHSGNNPPTIGPYYIWNSSTEAGEHTQHLPCSSTQGLIKDRLDTVWDVEAERARLGDNWRDDDAFCTTAGIRKILDMVFSCPVFNQQDETFTICHPDLDLQNILTDEDGNVTGIIDWDGTFIAPSCMGASAMPKFLNRDWFPRKVGGLFSFPNMAWRTKHYRQIYAAAMITESTLTEHPDAYTVSKSAIYTAVFGGLLELCGGGDIRDFVSKLLRKIPDLFPDEQEILIALGLGWPALEVMLKQEIAMLLEPELPSEEYL